MNDVQWIIWKSKILLWKGQIQVHNMFLVFMMTVRPHPSNHVSMDRVKLNCYCSYQQWLWNKVAVKIKCTDVHQAMLSYMYKSKCWMMQPTVVVSDIECAASCQGELAPVSNNTQVNFYWNIQFLRKNHWIVARRWDFVWWSVPWLASSSTSATNPQSASTRT